MTNREKLLLILTIFIGLMLGRSLAAQTQGSPSQIKGTGVPSSTLCASGNVGQGYYQTDGAAGQSAYSCTSAGWTNNTGGGAIKVTSQTTTVNGAINDSVTSLVVSANFASMQSTPFWIMIGSEQMKVTAVASTTWTVTRGDGGTTAAAQSNGATITEMIWFWSQKASTSSYQNNGGMLQLTDTTAQGTGADYSIRMLTKLQYSAPWTLIARVSINNSQATNYVGAGFCLWDVANPTKTVATYSAQYSSYWRGVSQLFSWDSGGFYTEVAGWSWTSPWTAPQPTVQPTLTTAQWIKIVDNSTNWLVYVSDDKSNWKQIGQVARNTYVTPGYAGVTINNRGGWLVATLSSFEQYNSVI